MRKEILAAIACLLYTLPGIAAETSQEGLERSQEDLERRAYELAKNTDSIENPGGAQFRKLRLGSEGHLCGEIKLSLRYGFSDWLFFFTTSPTGMMAYDDHGGVIAEHGKQFCD